ncbi:MAG: hypothetical protein ACI8V5_003278, partial [Limisphaerales bacterium]
EKQIPEVSGGSASAGADREITAEELCPQSAGNRALSRFAARIVLAPSPFAIRRPLPPTAFRKIRHLGQALFTRFKGLSSRKGLPC